MVIANLGVTNEPAQATTNSFAGVSGLISRFEPSNLNPTADVWTDSVDSSVTIRSLGYSISETLQLNDAANFEGAWGSVGNFQVVSGTTQDFIKFPTLFDTPDSYTIYYVARYSNVLDSSKRKRVLSDSYGLANIAAGFHDGSIGKMFYVGDWFTPELTVPCFQGSNYICQASVATQSIPASVTTVNDWVITGFRISGDSNNGILRTNGMTVGYETTAIRYRSTHKYGINAGDFGVGTIGAETSDFELADYLVFDTSLSDSQMEQVEASLAQRYGIALVGTAPDVPEITASHIAPDSLSIDWSAPLTPGSGSIYKYQTRIKDTGAANYWSYYYTSDASARTHDFVVENGVVLQDAHSYQMQVRALSTHGWSDWSADTVLTYSEPAVVSPPGQTNPISSPAISGTSSVDQSDQVGPYVPTKLKRGKTLKFGTSAPSGLAMNVTSSGACKTSRLKKSVTVQVLKGSKLRRVKVKRQTGWAVKMMKRGSCNILFTNSGDARFLPLTSKNVVTVYR